MALPPLNRVDHQPRCILSFDTSWDHERINEEIRAMPMAKRIEHPVSRYLHGLSRCDIDTVKQYIRPDGEPVEFIFRRLNMRELAAIEARAATSAPAARNLALSYALLEVEGAKVVLDRGGRHPPHGLTDEDLERLRELVGDEGIAELGEQATACSRELLEAEKKP